MFLLIDNYDSFTYNLLHFLGELGAELDVRRNDALTVDQAVALKPQGIVLSPGPCDPPKAGICMPLVEAAVEHGIPLFGVCLGHQSIGQALGGTVCRSPVPMHGKVSRVSHDGTGVFAGIPSPFTATRYHSLMVARQDLPADLVANAETEDGVIQGLRHVSKPIHGVQFHPESIATEHGHALLANFLRICGIEARDIA